MYFTLFVSAIFFNEYCCCIVVVIVVYFAFMFAWRTRIKVKYYCSCMNNIIHCVWWDILAERYDAMKGL